MHRRLNQLGVEMFPSYAGKLWARFSDAVGWLVAAAAVTTGVVMLAIVYESIWGWLVLFPLYACLAFMLLGT